MLGGPTTGQEPPDEVASCYPSYTYSLTQLDTGASSQPRARTQEAALALTPRGQPPRSRVGDYGIKVIATACDVLSPRMHESVTSSRWITWK